jgi:hypothetical protein
MLILSQDDTITVMWSLAHAPLIDEELRLTEGMRCVLPHMVDGKQSESE